MLQEVKNLMGKAGIQTANVFFMLLPAVISTLAFVICKVTYVKVCLVLLTTFLLYLVAKCVMGRIFLAIAIDTSTDKTEVFSRNQKVPQDEGDGTIYVPDEQEYYVTSSLDGISLCYFLQRNKEKETHKYVICLHGFNGNHTSVAMYSRLFFSLGYNVITVDMRGHGKSEARYCGLGILDARDLLDVVEDVIKKDSQAEICLFGISMGAATVMTALNYTLPQNVKCVIEDSGYTDVANEFRYQLKNNFNLPQATLYLVNPVVKRKAKYSLFAPCSLKGVKKATRPMLFIHGTRDKIVPEEMADMLFAACTAEKEIVKFNAGHIASICKEEERYKETVKSFLQKNF